MLKNLARNDESYMSKKLTLPAAENLGKISLTM